MRAIGKIVGLALLVSALCTGPAWAAISGLTQVATGLSNPMFVTHAPGDRSRLFIAQRGGAIRILNLQTGALEATPFLTMTGVSTDGEGGFLGMAFHPDYFVDEADGEGKFYVHVTTDSTTVSRIREFEVSAANPNVADLGSLREILSITQPPQTNHKGGWIGFSPNNKFLHIALGDGGGSNDNGTGHSSGGNAQDVTGSLLGKILRIDPTGDDFTGGADPGNIKNYAIPPTNPFKAGVGIPGDDGGLDEIWAFGLRNPFRDSFDRITGDLWIGDVGQDNREEISFQPGNSTGGSNFGWRLREGEIATPTPSGSPVGGAEPAGHVPPVYDYTHPDSTVPPLDDSQYNGRLVTGGYVYRGPDPSLQGKYFFFDSNNTGTAADDNYWMANTSPFSSVTNIDSMLTPNTGSPQFPVSFGEDAKGNLYIAYLFTGDVYRIATNQLLAGDYDADGEVNDDDYDVWRESFGNTAAPLPADGNGNGTIDAGDYVVWREHVGESVFAGAAGGAALVPEPATAAIIIAWFAFLPAQRYVRRSRNRLPPSAR